MRFKQTWIESVEYNWLTNLRNDCIGYTAWGCDHSRMQNKNPNTVVPKIHEILYLVILVLVAIWQYLNIPNVFILVLQELTKFWKCFQMAMPKKHQKIDRESSNKTSNSSKSGDCKSTYDVIAESNQSEVDTYNSSCCLFGKKRNKSNYEFTPSISDKTFSPSLTGGKTDKHRQVYSINSNFLWGFSHDLTLQKITIWLSKNWHFFQKNCHWQFGLKKWQFLSI